MPEEEPTFPYDPMKEQYPWGTDHMSGSMFIHGYMEQLHLNKTDLKRETDRLRKKRKKPATFGFQPPEEEA